VSGLRERKKSQTRRAIAEAAEHLFRGRGFDNVTVDEVAQAAQVSKKTVFNYFPMKEDLVFARTDDRESALLAAVEACRGGETIVEAFRQLCLQQTALIGRLRRSAGQGSGGVLDLVDGHPALQRKLHEINARLASSLAGALADLGSRPPDDPLVGALAAALLGAQTALYRSLRRRVAAHNSDTAIARAHRRDVNRVFDLLEQGLAHYPARLHSIRQNYRVPEHQR
jgi:AcrR family transcriptional regulator